MINKFYKYIEDVKSGKISTGKEIKQAIYRFEEDLKNENFRFDEDKAIKATTFISHLKHFTGKHNNLPFILEPWETFLIANLFGWVHTKTGLRRFSTAYIEVSRKNGKTAICAAISLFCLIAEGEPNAEVILAANSREQAAIAFSAVSNFSKKLDPAEKYIKCYRNEAKYINNRIKIVSADSSKLDGLNASCVILDEFHAAKDTRMFDVLKSSQGMREQPLFIIITTAGFDKKSPCYSLRSTAKDILQGYKKDDSQFIAIYNLDEGDDWTNKKNWIKSNPNLDVTIKSSFLKDEILKAKNNISLETGVKTKNLNIWCDTITTWIAESYVNNSIKKIDFKDIDGNEVYVGVDLSSNADITSVSYMFLKDEKYHFITKYYLPTDSLNSVQDKEYYKQQHLAGNITLTPGNVVDYNYILTDILEVNKENFISKLAYDSWNATQFAISATENYLNLEPYVQTISNFNRPTKTLERLLLSGNVIIDSNDITRWMFSNVHLKVDSNGNVKPDKSSKSKKIDGVISMLMALGVYLSTPHYQITII